MKNKYCHICVILDESGSMSGVKNDLIGGFNEFLQKQQAEPGEATISLIKFNDEYKVVYSMVPIKDAKPLTVQTYIPSGQTALYGGVGRSIDDLGKALLAMPEDGRPEKVLIVIHTDSEENDSPCHEWSKLYTLEVIKSKIEEQTKKYKWDFIYLGAGESAILDASKLGVLANKSIQYSASNLGTKGILTSSSNYVSSFRSCDSSKVSSLGFSDEDIKLQQDLIKT